MTNTVVVADEDQSFCAGFASVLARSGRYQVLASAHDDTSMLEAIKTHRPGMVIMEQALAGTGVGQVHDAIPGAHIVILSSDSAPKLPLKPAAGILSKSQDAHSIVAALDKITDHSPLAMIDDGRERPLHNRHPIPAPAAISRLSPRERQVLEFVAASYTSKEIAEALGITQRTVEVHRHHMLKKLELRGIADLVKFAIRAGLTKI